MFMQLHCFTFNDFYLFSDIVSVKSCVKRYLTRERAAEFMKVQSAEKWN